MSYSRKKLLVESIEGAKKTETRAKRIAKALVTLMEAYELNQCPPRWWAR
jgi:hypothetical protein